MTSDKNSNDLSDESQKSNPELNGEEVASPGDDQQREEEQLLSELDKAKNDLLYLRAEFDNYRKQAIKERAELLRYGAERLIVELLGVVDNFERALETEPTAENIESFKKGIELTAAELNSVLEKFGVRLIDMEGKPFDPSLAEALSREMTDKVKEGHVTKVYRKGYKLHDKLIRPAQVVVATPAAAAKNENNK